MTYLDDLRRRDGFLTLEPQDGPLFTVEDDGSIIMEFPNSHLAIKLSADTADGLAAGIEEARHQEAETVIDDNTIWPTA